MQTSEYELVGVTVKENSIILVILILAIYDTIFILT